MSFRCEFCNEPQPPATRPVRLVTRIRTDVDFGWLIAEEKNACAICADRVGAPRVDPRSATPRPINFTLTERAAAALASLYHVRPINLR